MIFARARVFRPLHYSREITGFPSFFITNYNLFKVKTAQGENVTLIPDAQTVCHQLLDPIVITFFRSQIFSFFLFFFSIVTVD